MVEIPKYFDNFFLVAFSLNTPENSVGFTNPIKKQPIESKNKIAKRTDIDYSFKIKSSPEIANTSYLKPFRRFKWIDNNNFVKIVLHFELFY